VLKDIMQHMEHPFYALSKKPETAIRKYQHNGQWLQIVPSVKGLATIYDKDILIYAISQIMAKVKRGEPVSPRVRINAHEFLMFSNRGTAGKDYHALCEALDRLAGTRISTNIQSGDEEQYDNFGLIDAASVRRKHGLDGRLLWLEIKLSDWVFNAIEAQEVLTLHRDYFRLRKPLERRIYELARKHCGQQSKWVCGVETLHKKSGSKSPLKQFRYLLREIAVNDHLPDYRFAINDQDQAVFINRDTMPCRAGETTRPTLIPPLDPDTYDRARAYAPGWCVHGLEAEWRAWAIEPPNHPDKAFLGFCKQWFEKHGPA
ncbi:MAG: replication initiator protein A, partial [Pseudomonadota bacterium]